MDFDNVPMQHTLGNRHGSMDALAEKVEQWAHDRNLIVGSTPKDQLAKFFEEAGEMAGGLARQNDDLFKDGMGDLLVVAVIICAQKGVSLNECLAIAYNEIKDRKGRMVDGVFVKEQDLPKG